MARAIWKGSISFGLVNVPVSLYTAEKRKDLQFHLLDRRDLSPLRYVRVNERTGEEVPWEEVVKGYEYEEDMWVIMTEEDFRAANVEATETVEIMDFVDEDKIPYKYFEKPYYLEPRKEGRKAYALLRETLRRSGKVGVAKVVIRTRQYLAALLVEDDMLVLDLMRYAYELRDPAEVNVPTESLQELGISEREIEMAGSLVEAMVAEWNPDKYKDEYREDILALIEKKIETGQLREVIEAPKPEKVPAGEVIDIMGLLKDSVEAAGKERKAAGGETGKAGGGTGRAAGGAKKAGGERERARKTA
ncbi:MAG: Ku protein [Actinobacteria bacterium]|nr:MAG: Ku protein [Actinomycetota bacterium]